MKKLFTLIASLLLLGALQGSAQIFWTENFTGTGTIASGGFTSTNGTWNIGGIGTEDVEHNEWYVSCMEGGKLAGTCGATCATGDLGATLHIGSTTVGDNGASYDAGGLCPILWCVTTDRRAQSPTINCTGKYNIRLKFYYLLNGQGSTDDGSVYYSSDGGSSWGLLVTPPKTAVCPSTQGRWDTLGVALPSSANNNPNVKIAFRWVNDDDGTGTDPSFAIDSVSLRTPSSGGGPVAASMTAAVTTTCEDSCITFTNTSTGAVDSFKWSCPAATIGTSTVSPASICFPTPGTHTVKLYLYNGGVRVDSASTTVTIKKAPAPMITKTGTTYSVPAAYTAYQWYTTTPPALIAGATNASYTTTVTGSYAVQVDSAGCKGWAIYTPVGVYDINGVARTYWLSQTGSTLTLHAAASINEPLTIDIYDAAGRTIYTDNWEQGNSVKQISGLSMSQGLYIIKLSSNNTSTVLRWLKQ